MNLEKISDSLIEREFSKRFFQPVGDMIECAEEAAKHMNCFFGQEPDREMFIAIFLNGRNQNIHTEVLFVGSLTSAPVYPREILKKALKHQAAALILGHNHPSGNLNPSRQDIDITEQTKNALATIDVAVHDHIIVTSGGHYSMAENGLI